MSEKNTGLAPSKIRNGNDFVKSFYKMTAEQQNLFYFAVACLDWNVNPFERLMSGKPLSELPANTFSARFKIQELFEKMDLPNTKNMKDVYAKNFRDLSHIVVKTTNEKGKTQWTPLFACTVWYDDDIDIIFNTYFLDLIFQQKYATADLKILGQLSRNSKNNYAQRLYFYLSMYRNTQGQKKFHNEHQGEWTVTISEDYFRELVQMPKDENTRRNNFRAMIKTLVSKINKCNSEFVTSVNFGGYGSTEILFTCNENLQLWKIAKTDSDTSKKEKNQLNRETEEIAYFKKKYSEEWQEEMKNQLGTEFLFEMPEQMKNRSREFEAYKILKERHSKK